MAPGDLRRRTDRLRLTRPRDAKPYTWTTVLVLGLCWGVVCGAVAGFLEPRHGFSFAALALWSVSGIVVYAPVVHGLSSRRWRRATSD
jgi:hypothetical protein